MYKKYQKNTTEKPQLIGFVNISNLKPLTIRNRLEKRKKVEVVEGGTRLEATERWSKPSKNCHGFYNGSTCFLS